MALVRIYQKPAGTPANSSVFAVEIQQNNIWYTKKVSWEDLKGLIAGATSLVFNNGTVTFTTPDGVAHEVLSVDDEVLAASGNPVTGGAVSTALAGKQDTLTFDQVPTDGSTNPVESNGIYDALALKQDTLTFDSTPTDGSTNPVTSQGIYAAISAVTSGIDWKEAVATYADIATTYPNPEDGWTVTTLDDDHTYRYNGTAWVDLFSLITLATSTKDGLMSSSDFTKLSGIEAGANKTTDEDITGVVVDLTDTQQTASANPITLETKQAGLAKSCAVEMNPIQDLHGYPNPWVGGAGKNKFDKSSVTLGKMLTNTGVEYNSSVGSYSDYIPIIANTPYYFSHIAGIGAFYSMCVYDSSKTFLENVNIQGTGDASGTVTFTQGAYIRVNVYQANLDTCQIELGSTATSYAPYSNICPISGRTEASVKRTGKNLLQGVESGLIDQTTGQDTPNNNNKRSVGYVRANHGSKITLSGFTSLSGGLRIFVYQDEEYVRNFTVSASTDTYFTITVPDDGNMIRFQGSNEKFGSNNIQAELGETATAYEPYTAETHTKEFGQTVYVGNLDLTSGRATIEQMKLVLNGTENWSDDTGRNGVYYLFNTMASSTYADCVCDRFKTIHSNAEMQSLGIAFGIQNKAIYIPRLFDGAVSGVTDLASWKTYLSNNNMEITYPLSTPTTIQLSPEALTLLKGLNIISTDGDKVQVEFSDIPVGDYSTLLDYIKSLEDRIKALEGGN